MPLAFDAAYYLNNNTDVAAAIRQGKFGAGMSTADAALLHFNTFGWTEGRNPNAVFDTTYYLKNNPDVNLAKMNPLTHYLQYGINEASRAENGNMAGISSANFDSTTYLANNPDLGKAGITTAVQAWTHYIMFGQFETGRGVIQTTAKVAINPVGGSTTSTTSANFALTVNTDSIVGTAGNDLISGAQSVSTAGTYINTLNNADTIDGGSGTNGFSIQLVGAAAGVVTTPSSIKNIQILTVESTGMANAVGATLDLSYGDSSITTVNVNNTAAPLTIQNINSAVATLNISNDVGKAVSVLPIATALAGSSDTLALNLSNVSGGAAITVASGYETININSTITSTTANNIALAAGSVATLNVTGAGGLTLLSDATMLSVTKVDASAFTGALIYTAAPANTKDMTVTGGSGNDTINLGGTYTSADTINGGAGTDTLAIASASITAPISAQGNVTNVEILAATTAFANGATVTMSYWAGVTGIKLGVADAGALTVNYVAGTSSFDAGTFDFSAGATTLTAAGTATTDVLNITLGSTIAGVAGTGNAVTTTGFETVNILAQGGADQIGAAFTMTPTAANETLKVTGNQTLTIVGGVTADTIDASASTGALVMSAATVAAAGANITGSSGADTLFGSTNADVITGGAGNDRIIGSGSQAALNANQADVLTGGAGTDTFVFYDTLAGAATVSNATAGTLTKITDFVAGTDKIAIIDGGPATSMVVNTLQTITTAANVGAVAAAITAIGASVVAGALQSKVVVVSGGAAAGTYLYINDTTAGVSATNDILIDITGVTGTIAASDFVFA